MDIGTAKPTIAERERRAAPPARPRRSRRGVLGGRLRPRGRARPRLTWRPRDAAALVVGGTGLWLRALATGLDVDASPADPELRAALEAELASDGLPALAARLSFVARLAAARTDLRNPRRVVRALEIALPPRRRAAGRPAAATAARSCA